MSAVLEAHEPSARYLVAEQPALVRQFGLLVAAPGGVLRLRDLILTLAVQGKLVEQSGRDEPVDVVLREIQLVKGGAVPRRRSRATDTDDALIAPFSLPDTWDWVRLGAVTDISGGVTLGRKGSIEQPMTLPYLRVANVQRWNVLCDDLKTVTIGRAELARYQLRAGDLLITEGGDWDKVGRTAIWRDELAVCLHQNHVFKARGLTPSWNPEWAQLYLNSPIARTYFASCSKQTTNLASINMTQLKACAFPLPPVAEQARIVARVDELMRLCDALEAKRHLEAEQHARLLGTLLGTMTDSSTPEELAANWQRVADHFDLLLDRPEAVDALEQTILQLAVRGLLVPQDPSDPPAVCLIDSAGRRASSTVGSGFRVGSNPCAGPDEPKSIPSGWEVVQLQQVADTRLGKMLDKAKNRGLPRPYLRNTNVQWRRFDLDDVKVMKLEQPELAEFRLVAGDLLVCEGGEPGRCAIWRDRDREMYFQKALHRVRPRTGVSAEYIAIALESDARSGALAPYFTGTTIKHFVGQALQRYTFPLPPSAEQARIVARVTELRYLCAALRQRVAAGETTHSHLAEALVESGTA